MPTAEQLLDIARSHPERSKAMWEAKGKECSEKVIQAVKEAVVSAATDHGREWKKVMVNCKEFESEGPAMRQLQRVDWKSILPGCHVKVGYNYFEDEYVAGAWIPFVCVHWNGECFHQYRSS